MRVALPPNVAPNIMATNTGRVEAGQSVKSAPNASSGTSSAVTKYPLTMRIDAATTGMLASRLEAIPIPASITSPTTSRFTPNDW